MNEPAAKPVHLPVVPTGRVESLRRTMTDQPDGVSPSASPTSDAIPPASATPGAAAEAAAGSAVSLTSPPLSDDPERVFQRKLLEGKVIEAISQIYDPEIPVNIYELGLIYKVDVHDDNSVYVQMTLTAPACPVAGSLPGQVESKIESVPEVTKATVELVWDPPWSRDLMSEAAQLQLGLM